MNWLIKLLGGWTDRELTNMLSKRDNFIKNMISQSLEDNTYIQKLQRELSRYKSRNHRTRDYIKEAIIISNKDIKTNMSNKHIKILNPFEAKLLDILNGRDKRTGKNKK